MDKDILLALTHLLSAACGATIMGYFDYKKYTRIHAKQKPITVKLTRSELSCIISVESHFMFIGSDSYPRRPICPDCAKNSIKSYLSFQEKYNTICWWEDHKHKDSLFCGLCKYKINLPDGISYEQLQEDAGR